MKVSNFIPTLLLCFLFASIAHGQIKNQFIKPSQALKHGVMLSKAIDVDFDFLKVASKLNVQDTTELMFNFKNSK
ncbi:hypothetical protein [Botryobacter ruber]|uniref:hypothetical protein n=1 Tax=Botryobacter ruber TaxID=2171629 RepID=UPI0013E38604|nr:hypothetical protein [Botryobacter ruber]